MMIINEKLFEYIWVSGDYQTVFCTEEEKEKYLSFLSSMKEIPRGMSIVLIQKRLNKQYSKNEIMKATPEKIKVMIK